MRKLIAVMCIALAGCHVQGAGKDVFTDSDGLRITTDKALWYCYKEVSYLAKSKPEIDPTQVYYRCLFNYGVVI